MEKVKVKKLSSDAILPKYGSLSAAGADRYVCEGKNVEIPPHTTVLIHTQIALEIPEGYVGLIYARSGLATKRGLAPANKVGVIDSDYRGEIMVALHNHSDITAEIENQERVAQLVIAPYLRCDFCESDCLDDTERGEGGFGSTGKK